MIQSVYMYLSLPLFLSAYLYPFLSCVLSLVHSRSCTKIAETVQYAAGAGAGLSLRATRIKNSQGEHERIIVYLKKTVRWMVGCSVGHFESRNEPFIHLFIEGWIHVFSVSAAMFHCISYAPKQDHHATT